MRISFILLSITLFIHQSSQLSAQSEMTQLGDLSFPRTNAMGHAGIGMVDSISANLLNPAALAFLSSHQMLITYSTWMPQYQMSDLYYAQFFLGTYLESLRGTLSIDAAYLSLGDFNHPDEQNIDQGTFTTYEFTLTMGYSRQFGSNLGFGINLRYIRSVNSPFSETSHGRKGIASSISFDLATLWYPQSLPLLGEIEDRLGVGINLSNLGPKLTYIGAAHAYPLPTNLRLGFAVNVFKSEYNNITAVVDFSRMLVRLHPSVTTYDAYGNVLYVTNPSADNLPKSLITAWDDGGLRKVTIGAGLEYWYGNPKQIALRLGYLSNGRETREYFLTYGGGFRYGMFGVDLSYLSSIDKNLPFDETLSITLSCLW